LFLYMYHFVLDGLLINDSTYGLFYMKLRE
jgi:hypothetical protein